MLKLDSLKFKKQSNKECRDIGYENWNLYLSDYYPLLPKVFSKEGLLESTIQTGKSDLTVVGISSGIGAVIGLSSLAFIDTSKKSAPILMGAALGGIVGLGIVAWGHANSPKPYYSENPDFNTELRRDWHNHKFLEHISEPSLSAVSYNFPI